MKRFLSFLSASLIILCSLLPLVACDKQKVSVGLEYSLNLDGNTYSVVGIGDCVDTDLIIPAEYKGKPVTAIGDRAFANYKSLKSVVIANSVVSIGMFAFVRCDYLESVTFGKSLKKIEQRAFAFCGYLKNVTFPEGLERIGGNAFEECEIIGEIVIPDSVVYIGSYAFAKCTYLTKATLGNSLRSLNEGVFEYCRNMEELSFGTSIKNIYRRSLKQCYLRDIYFDGTIAELYSINFAEGWEQSNTLGYCTIHCTDGDVSASELYKAIR